MPQNAKLRSTRWQDEIKEIFRWFTPGLGVKRWFLFILAGTTLLGVGFAILLLNFYRTDSTNETFLALLSLMSLRFLPRFLRALIFGGIGVWLIGYGVVRLNRSILRPYLRTGQVLLDDLSDYRRRARGPRIVAIGGGHGLSNLLRGLKMQTRNLTAVVTVADDGGSSGRLRSDFGILPPGDIRNCLAALSNDEEMLTQLFQYRFSDAGDLSGHSFGNLLITALADITGSFESAIEESGKALSVSGRVLPSTLRDVKLVADVRLPHAVDQVRVAGESRIPQMAGQIRRVWLEPNDAPAYPPVLETILNADMIIVGPGSLYTSLLPNLLVQDLLGAIRSSRAAKAYVCNLVTQAGETDLFTCGDHVRALEEHIGKGVFDVILCNCNYEEQLTDDMQWVKADEAILADSRTVCVDLVDADQPWRHDIAKLTAALIEILDERALTSEEGVRAAL